MKRQRRLRTRTRTAPRSRARSAEPCTFIMETARRGNAACTINVGFLVRRPQQRPPLSAAPNRPRSRCAVVFGSLQSSQNRGRSARGGNGRERRGRGGSWPTSAVAGVAGVRRARGPRAIRAATAAPPARRWPLGLARRARVVWRRRSASGGSRTGSSIPAFTRSGVRIRRNLSGILYDTPTAVVVPAALAGRIYTPYAAPWGAYTPHPGVRIRRTLGCVYAPTRVNAPTTAYKHICVNAASGA